MGSGKKPGESGRILPVLAALTVFIALAGLLAYAAASADKPDGRYRNEEYSFSITFPEKWKFFEYRQENPMLTVGTANTDGASVSVSVSGDDPVFGYRDGLLICEQIKENIAGLGGYDIKCTEGTLLRRPAFYAFYVQRSGGEERPYRFVHQVLCRFGSRVYTITTFAPGTSESEAKDVYNRNVDDIMRAITSFWIKG